MLKTLLGSFFKPHNKSRKPKIVPQTSSSCVYRDELDKKPPPPHYRRVKKQVKFDLKPPEQQIADQEHGSDGGGGAAVGENNGGGVRVKVLMRREAANRLLSRCGEGGVLTLMDVSDELKHIPFNHITIISSSSSSSSPLSVCDYIRDDKLETVQEED